MEKVLEISGKPVKLSNNVAWTMEYRDQFGRDIVPVIMPLMTTIIEGLASVISETGGGELNTKSIAEAIQGRALDIMLPFTQIEFVDIVVNVLWSMAKAADDDIEPPKRWVRQFDEFPVDDILPELYDMVLKGFVSSKNLKRLESVMEDAKKLRPMKSHLTTLSSPGSSEG